MSTGCKPVELDVTMTADDIYHGTLTVALRKSAGNILLALLGLAAFTFLNPFVKGPVSFVMVGALYLFFLAAFLYWTARRNYRTNRAYRQSLRFAFDHQGMDVSGYGFSFHSEWCNFYAALEDSRVLLLCSSNSEATILPKRCFATPAQLDAFRSLVRAHVTGKVSLRT